MSIPEQDAAAALAASVARCGLVCGLCRPDGGCVCRGDNHCGKRRAPGGCLQHDCSLEKGLAGCWECPEAPCGRDMHSPDKVKIRVFIRYLKAYGPEAFAARLAQNAAAGVVYHRGGIVGDYDLPDEQAVWLLLHRGPAGREGGV